MDEFKPDIWKLQAQLNIEGLIKALESDDAGIRKRAATALRALGAVNAIDTLKALLETEPEPDTRAHFAAAIEALEQVRAEQTDQADETNAPIKPQDPEVQALLAQLRSKKVDDVIKAARALAARGEKLAVEPLVVLFNTPKVPINVRLAIAEALLKLESAPVEVALLGALRSPEWRVRRNGAAILGKLKADWAVEPLAKALHDSNGSVRLTAHAALRNIDTTEAQRALRLAPELDEKTGKKKKPRQPVDKIPPNQDAMPKQQTSEELERIRKGTRPRRPEGLDEAIKAKTTPPKDETQKISWPRRTRKPANPSLAPTRPLNPQTLEEARERLRRMQSQDEDSTDKE